MEGSGFSGNASGTGLGSVHGTGMTLLAAHLLARDSATVGRASPDPAPRPVVVDWIEVGFEREVKPVADESESDDVLMIRIAAGDADAFAAFYDRHEAAWYGLAWRILRNDREAEDVLQDAAVQLWERADEYRSDLGKPISWAVTMVRNKAIDRLRAMRRRAELAERAEAEWAGDAGGSGAGGGEAWTGDCSEAVRKTLGILPQEQRRALELAFFAGLSQTEIAERVAAPLGTVKARIRRGMLAMRDALEGTL